MILIGLGSNLSSTAGSPAATVRAALAALEPNSVAPVKVSNLYCTVAWPDPAEPAFVNAVAQVNTALPPAALLNALHEIERTFGRVRSVPNAPRTLDLDILDYDGRIDGGPPTLPHPRLEGRAFVLVPLAEIAPTWHHPISGFTAEDLLRVLPEYAKEVRLLEPNDLQRNGAKRDES